MFHPYSEADDTFVETYRDISGRLHVDDETGHASFLPLPEEAVLARLYNGEYDRPDKDDDAASEFNSAVIEVARGVKRHMQAIGGLPDVFNHHDVGCGLGRLVWAMNNVGVNATGNEANATEVAIGNLYCKGALSDQTLEAALTQLDYKIDLFTALHVLEHIPDTRATMRTMATELSDQGLVYICVPNGHSLLALLSGRRADPCYNYPGHLHYFTPKSLTNMLFESGLEPILLTTRSLPVYDGGVAGIDRALTIPEVMMPRPQAWADACCQNLLGYEIFCLAALPGNAVVAREPDIVERAEKAFRAFTHVRG